MLIYYVAVFVSGIGVVLFAYWSWDIYKLNGVDEDFSRHSLPYYLISLTGCLALLIWALSRVLKN